MGGQKINSELVERFCSEFKGRYLTLKAFKKLDKRERQFHLFGHWNVLHSDDSNIYHSYLNGATGDIEKCFCEMPLSDLDKIVYIKHDDTFILFKRSKGMIKPEFVYNQLDTLTRIDDKRVWLYENGIQVRRKYWQFNDKMLIEWKMKDAFTGEELDPNSFEKSKARGQI